jgi:hypothetical protein
LFTWRDLNAFIQYLEEGDFLRLQY